MDTMNAAPDAMKDRSGEPVSSTNNTAQPCGCKSWRSELMFWLTMLFYVGVIVLVFINLFGKKG